MYLISQAILHGQQLILVFTVIPARYPDECNSLGVLVVFLGRRTVTLATIPAMAHQIQTRRRTKESKVLHIRDPDTPQINSSRRVNFEKEIFLTSGGGVLHLLTPAKRR